MSFLIGPVLDTSVRLMISAAGTLLYYTGTGAWWLGKRLIYGKAEVKPTLEEQLLQQNEELTKVLKEVVADQKINLTERPKN